MKPESLSVRSALDYASGTADRNGTAIDMANFEWAIFNVHFATIAASAVTAVKVQQCDTSGGTYADLEGTSISVAADDDDQIFTICVKKPLEQFLRVVIDKDATNATAESATVVLGGARDVKKLESITDEVTVEIHVSPAEGTA